MSEISAEEFSTRWEAVQPLIRMYIANHSNGYSAFGKERLRCDIQDAVIRGIRIYDPAKGASLETWINILIKRAGSNCWRKERKERDMMRGYKESK